MTFSAFDPYANGLSFSNSQATSFIGEQEARIDSILLPTDMVRGYRATTRLGRVQHWYFRQPRVGLLIQRILSSIWGGVCFGMCIYVQECWQERERACDKTIQQSWKFICGAQYSAHTWLESQKNRRHAWLERVKNWMSFRGPNNLSALEDLREHLKNEDLQILILIGTLPGEQNAAHAVIAYDVQDQGYSMTYEISIYDPNYSRQRRLIIVDKNGRISSEGREIGSGYECNHTCHFTQFKIWRPRLF